MSVSEQPRAQVRTALRRIDELESHLQALVPEPDRGERMLREALGAAVVDRPLSEAVVGIKDVIR
ncbi:MAG: hypothetical protein J2P28_17065, partial [Actinobacteria bacterium]|nr:hypothetical protein [Actinomycetota bacterium]